MPTDLTADVLSKTRELIAVVIDPVRADHCSSAARRSAHAWSSPSRVFLDIKVTEGTTTKDEKAAYVQGVFAGMQSILGPFDPASFVVIHDLRADAWGYGGETQEYRYVAGKPA